MQCSPEPARADAGSNVQQTHGTPHLHAGSSSHSGWYRTVPQVATDLGPMLHVASALDQLEWALCEVCILDQPECAV